MRGWQTILFGGAMLAGGYFLGTAGVLEPEAALAQQADTLGISQDTQNKIRAAQRALVDALEQLKSEGKYNALTEEPNAFLVFTGGGDARRDLEEGNGVDPETFAALYAGKVAPEIASKLGTDDEGRVTYNDKAVQMYSRRRLTRLFAQRAQIQEF